MPIGAPNVDAGAVVLTIAALAAAGACLRALVATRRGARCADGFPGDRRRRDRTGPYRAAAALWGALAGLVLLLAIAGPLEVLDALTELGRALAQRNGWYRERRPVQAAMILTIAGAAFVGAVLLVRRARGSLPRQRPAVAAAVAIGAFILADALSLHAVDAVLQWSWHTVSVREILALIVLVPVARCAQANTFAFGKPRPRTLLAGAPIQSSSTAA